MKRVDQTTFGSPRSVIATRELVAGNCFSACIASVLDLSIEDVPLFVDEEWWDRFGAWCADRRITPTFHAANGRSAPRGYSIAGGVSPRNGVLHASVFLDGRPFHDPNPDRTFFDGPVLDWLVLHPMRDAETPSEIVARYMLRGDAWFVLDEERAVS